jgi:predicted alpha/beta-hydrolase family hydrolase
MIRSQTIEIAVDETHTVSGLLDQPRTFQAGCVLAHGAGAGMDHRFMSSVAEGLVRRNVAVLRFQFPYMQAGSRRPDRPALARLTIRAAMAAAGERMPGIALFAGGKSFGGRMTSQTQAERPLPNVSGLFFLGFPLHAAGKPSVERADHLRDIEIPMLFFQGTRDTLAETQLIQPVVRDLGRRATLNIVEGSDHSFHVPVRSGHTDAEVLDGILDDMTAWIAGIAKAVPG